MNAENGILIHKLKPKHDGKRLFFLDNLKVVLTCIVVTHHASSAYVSIYTGWVIHQNNIPQINDTIIGFFMSINYAFLMALFFMISAYFIPASIKRKGIKKFVKERFIRMGIPVLFFLLIIFPIPGIITHLKDMSPTDYLINKYFNLSTGELRFGHTWFLFILMIFSCFFALYYYLSKNKRITRLHVIKVPGNLQIILFTIVLAIVMFIIRIFYQPGLWTRFHILEPASFPEYIALFTVGILAYKNKWIFKIPVSMAVIWGSISALAMLSTPLILKLILQTDQLWAKGLTLGSFVVSAWDAVLCVGLSISLTTLFREKFNFQGKILRKMSRDAFAVYLLHPIVIILFQGLLLNVALHPFAKFIIVAILGIVLSFVLSHFIKKIPYVSRIL